MLSALVSRWTEEICILLEGLVWSEKLGLQVNYCGCMGREEAASWGNNNYPGSISIGLKLSENRSSIWCAPCLYMEHLAEIECQCYSGSRRGIALTYTEYHMLTSDNSDHMVDSISGHLQRAGLPCDQAVSLAMVCGSAFEILLYHE